MLDRTHEYIADLKAPVGLDAAWAVAGRTRTVLKTGFAVVVVAIPPLAHRCNGGAKLPGRRLNPALISILPPSQRAVCAYRRLVDRNGGRSIQHWYLRAKGFVFSPPILSPSLGRAIGGIAGGTISL